MIIGVGTIHKHEVCMHHYNNINEN
jgi:hypothetical protein